MKAKRRLVKVDLNKVLSYISELKMRLALYEEMRDGLLYLERKQKRAGVKG